MGETHIKSSTESCYLKMFSIAMLCHSLNYSVLLYYCTFTLKVPISIETEYDTRTVKTNTSQIDFFNQNTKKSAKLLLLVLPVISATSSKQLETFSVKTSSSSQLEPSCLKIS